MGSFKKIVGRTPEQMEMDRILSLPVRLEPNVERVEIESFLRLNADAFGNDERLLPTQVDALLEFEAVKGGLFPIGVGFGKSGIALMTSQIAMERGWARKILLLVPVHLVSGLMRRHIPEWRRRVNLSVDFHVISGKSKKVRHNIAKSNVAGVYVFPYSLLSQPDALELLELIKPDMVVADEVHRLKNPRSACTKRIMHIIKNSKPDPLIFVGMSGSMTKKTIMEYHHLSDAALNDASPLPRKAGMAFTWGLVVDAGSSPTPSLVAGAMGKLINWAYESFPAERELFSSRTGVDNARNAYRKRLTTAPGVVATGDARPDASLSIHNFEVGPCGARILELDRKAKKDFETPEGEPIDHAIHVYKWRRELSSGFYNSLVWPKPEDHARNRKIQVGEATERIMRAKVHLSALQKYHAGLREFFKEAPVGLDTPTDVARSIYHHGADEVGQDLADLWYQVKDADFVGRPDRLEIPVRVDDFKIRAAVNWAKLHEHGLMWVFHHEMGEWLVEALKKEGLDPVYAPSGADELIESIGDPGRGGKGDRLVVSSVPAHGEGRNLQAFQNQVFVEWPRSATLAEQALGRVHRTGQTMDEVAVHTMIATEFDEMNRAATLSDALYVQQTIGAVQRVLYADYAEMPKIFDPRVLAARGAAPLSTDPRLWAKIKELFGE